MKILADESVDSGIVSRLRRDRHDVGYVAEMSPGIMDEEVLALASNESTLLLTADKDFGELIFRQGYVKHGIVLYRLAGLSSQKKAEIISSVISEHGNELLAAFSVITEKAVRIRRV
jgi:predicted nuclease of predicted toxin-antitoxin system